MHRMYDQKVWQGWSAEIFIEKKLNFIGAISDVKYRFCHFEINSHSRAIANLAWGFPTQTVE